MMKQVAPLVSLSNATDYHYWASLGFKGALITICIAVIVLSVWKGKIGFISISPSEAGIRELCGWRLWRVGPGLHPDIEGVWKVRKTSVALIKIRIDDECGIEMLTWQFGVTIWLQVVDSKNALIAQIYNAQDLTRENMENSEAVEQAKDILIGNTRELLEGGVAASDLAKRLKKVSKKELLNGYGYCIRKSKVRHLVKRPQSELAEAITNSRLSPAVLGGVLGHLEVVQGQQTEVGA